MNKQTNLKVQTLQLRRLLEQAGDDPIMAPQLRERLADAERKLELSLHEPGALLPKESAVLPRAAIFLKGGGVREEGIRPSLAGEALIQYEKMFIEQALHDEREAARQEGRQRRRRGTASPGLIFTGTPRGSFGLEFVPQPTDDPSQLAVHSGSLRNVARALQSVAESGSASFEETIKQIPPRLLGAIKQFMSTLARHDAELRLAFPDQPARTLSLEQVKTSAERLEKEVVQETVDMPGIFRGVTRDSGRFDFRSDAGEFITGIVADDMTEEDLERIHSLTNKNGVAQLQTTTVTGITGAATTTYVLMEVRPLQGGG